MSGPLESSFEMTVTVPFARMAEARPALLEIRTRAPLSSAIVVGSGSTDHVKAFPAQRNKVANNRDFVARIRGYQLFEAQSIRKRR